MQDFINMGLHLPAQAIQSCFRLGKYVAGRVRPIKITFCSKASQGLLINNLSALRVAAEKIKNISVSVDRTQDERSVFKAKIQEAKTLAEQSGKKYVVRGTYSPYIVERK